MFCNNASGKESYPDYKKVIEYMVIYDGMKRKPNFEKGFSELQKCKRAAGNPYPNKIFKPLRSNFLEFLKEGMRPNVRRIKFSD